MDPLPVGLNVNKKEGDICALSLFCCEYAYKTPAVLCKTKEQFAAVFQTLLCRQHRTCHHYADTALFP